MEENKAKETGEPTAGLGVLSGAETMPDWVRRNGIPGATKTFEIPKTCPKCGEGDVAANYDEVHNELALSCPTCGYRWSKETKDRNDRPVALQVMEALQGNAMAAQGRVFVGMADAMNKAAVAAIATAGPLPGPGAVPAEKTAHIFHCHPEVREHVRRAYNLVVFAARRNGQGRKGATSATLEEARTELELAEALL